MRVGLLLLAVVLLAPAARAQNSSSVAPPAAPPDAAPSLRLRSPSGPAEFVVADPAARRSAAWRRARPRDKAVSDPDALVRGAGYELTSRVIVRAANAAAVSAVSGPHPIRPLAGLRNYWLVETDSVAQAAALADAFGGAAGVQSAAVDMRVPLALRNLPSDPRFGAQWHLHNTQIPIADVNAEPAWMLGLTGAGVVIGIVDTAIDVAHPDLAANFNLAASRPWSAAGSFHGTAVAGIAAAVANNGEYGAGMAYGAQFSTQVLGDVSDNAAGLAWRNDLNDIKNNSWGPLDNATAWRPDQPIMAAIEQGVRDGRGGRGEIFIWAAGNGGFFDDRVDYDPYASSRYTISVGSIGDLDQETTYSEQGSSLMLVAASSGNSRSIYTIQPDGGETFAFSMTSAAAPLAAGVAALLLEQRPDLHWRDVRQILIDSARRCDPAHAGWTVNGAGRDIHYSYGFGAVDAGAATLLASDWTRLPHELELRSGVVPVDAQIPDNTPAGIARAVNIAEDLADDLLIETVELIVNVDSPYIGDLFIDLTSPAGTNAVLARRRNDSQRDYRDYTFTSVRQMDEFAAGEWTVRIADRAAADVSTWLDFELRIHGRPRCPLDLDLDGVYGLADVALLLERFGHCAPSPAFEPAADITNDGCVNLSDLGELLARFGTGCE